MVEVDWTFGGSWPYEARWFDSADGRMHYVDVGPRDGRPVVLLHGNPTWGYLYRNFVGPLADAGHRAIVPDHLGFGRSEKPDDSDLYRIPRHADRLEALLESLDLRDVTIVPQDWGGPIGLRWAVRHPDRVGGLFILNTYAHRPPGEGPAPASAPTVPHARGRRGDGQGPRPIQEGVPVPRRRRPPRAADRRGQAGVPRAP
jgi:haloalkane dehalogenase